MDGRVDGRKDNWMEPSRRYCRLRLRAGYNCYHCGIGGGVGGPVAARRRVARCMPDVACCMHAWFSCRRHAAMSSAARCGRVALVVVRRVFSFSSMSVHQLNNEK
jgi:hypothetical protein